jgi:hypothetical protein
MVPIPVLDHIVVNVHRHMDEAADIFARLGFTLTPRGHHTLGSVNHLAIFATDYLELIGLPEGNAGRQDLLDWPIGWNGVVFNTEDAAALHAALAAAGVAAGPPNDFSRPVVLADGPHDAAFRTVRLPHETTPAGRLYFCQHKTRDLVWRDAWRGHANGVTGIARIVFAAADPQRLAQVFARVFGAGCVVAGEGGLSILAGLVRIDLVTPAEAAARYGDAVADPAGRPEWIAAVAFRVRSLAQAETALGNGGIEMRRRGAGLIVAAPHAMGAAMVFAA